MKKIFFLSLSFFLLLALCSCGKKEDLLHYQKYPFEGEFEILRKDASFTLRISGDAWDENNGERSLVSEIIAPEDMKGLRISRTDGKNTYSLGGIEFEESGNVPLSMGDFAEYFELVASPGKFSKENESTFAFLVTDKGENVRITFSGDGLPTRFEGEKMIINVISYKVKK